MPDVRAEWVARLRVLSGFRFLLIALSGALIALLVPDAFREGGVGWMPVHPSPLWILLGIAAANLLLLAVHARLQRLRMLAILEHVADVLGASLLVGLTGVSESPLTFLYFGPLIAASLFLSGRWSLALASLATVCLSGLELWRAVATEEVRRLGSSLPDFTPALVAQGFAFHLVAYLSGALAATLRRARLLNRGVLDTIHEGVLTLDREDRIAFVNASARELLDLPEDEPLAGRPASEVLRDPRFDVVRSVLLDAPGRRQETLLLSPGWRKLPISIRTSVLVDEFGHSWGVVALIGNRTVYKRMLEAVQAAERLSAVSELGASLAHEIRNPLASIRGSVQELKGRPGVSEGDAQLMGIVLRESDRLDRIIKEFLEFARTKRASMVDVNLREVLEDVALILEKSPLGGKDRVRLEVAGPLSCRGDPDQLRQVFLNLGINALEASHGYAPILLRAFQSENRGPLQFPGGAQAPGEEPVRWGATVEVIDRGDGIDPRVRERIFDPFFTTKPGGTGMGLAIVSRILKEHGAVIELESMPGAGSSFRVWIPAGYEEPSPSAPAVAPAGPSPAPPGDKMAP